MTVGSRTGPERLWTSRTWPLIAGLLSLMTFIAFESFAVTTVLPVVMADLGGPQWYSLAYAATITAALVGMVVGGAWSDQSGPRGPLAVGGALFLGGLTLCAAAPDSTAFIFGRLLQGLGGGIDSVILYVLIAQRIAEGARPRMFGLLTAAWLVPSMAGPVVAGALTDLAGWRTVFGLVLAGAMASLLGLLHVTRAPGAQTRVPGRRTRVSVLDVVGGKGTRALVAALLLVVLHVGGQRSPSIATPLVVATLVALVMTARGILPAGTLLLRGAPQRLVALRAILGATVTTTDLYLTLYLQAERGHAPTTAGLVIAIGAVGWAAGAWLQGRFSSTHVTHQRLILLATPLVVAGPAGVLLYTTTDLHLGAVVAGCLTMGAGMGIAYPRLTSATLALADSDERGTYSSALQSGESMSVGATTALTALILTSVPSASAPFTLVYVVLVGLAGLAVVVALSHRLSAQPPVKRP